MIPSDILQQLRSSDIMVFTGKSFVVQVKDCPFGLQAFRFSFICDGVHNVVTPAGAIFWELRFRPIRFEDENLEYVRIYWDADQESWMLAWKLIQKLETSSAHLSGGAHRADLSLL